MKMLSLFSAIMTFLLFSAAIDSTHWEISYKLLAEGALTLLISWIAGISSI